MSDLRIEATRGDIVESVHVVSVAVVDPAGRLVAHAGEPARISFWRSAAKPFQALPLLEDGAADALGLTPAELALACASHSSEPKHLAVAQGFLRRIGATEDDLACGPHQPLSAAVAERVAREGITLTPLWSNCSGKHAGMLALARHRGWPSAGYHRPEHPVQRRILEEVSRWTGVPAARIPTATDGCTAVTFALPLAAMARAWAGFGAAFGPAIVLSLYWPRMTRDGALAGILVGGLTVIAWPQLPGRLFTLYELVPGFLLSALAIWIVSSLRPQRP